MGTQDVQMKAASPGCVCKRSSVQVFLLITKMPSGVKCKRLQRVAIRPSRNHKLLKALVRLQSTPANLEGTVQKEI